MDEHEETRNKLPDNLAELSKRMFRIAVELANCGYMLHAHELRGVAEVAEEWAEELKIETFSD